MPDSEHVPNKPGKKNWVEKTGGLPEYINRIAKDLMDKGMSESHAIATAVNTVKKWARGGGGVTPKTRAKAAAALAQWESKKAASHVGLSTPTRLERTRHARLRSMDLAAVLDRASSIVDPEARDRATHRLLDLAGTQAPVTKSYNIDRVRDAYSGLQSKKRQAFYARQAKQREAAGTLGSPMIDSPSSGPAYRYVKEVWNTHLIVKDDNNGLFKVPYTVGNSGADISFGNEVPVTEQYVELSDPADGWLADLDNRGNVTALAGEVFDLAFGQAESSGTATTSAALKTAYTARDAKAAKAVARKRAAGSRKTKRRARKGSTLHATQVRVGAKMRAMAAAEAHPGQPASKAIRDAVKVHQAQERVQAKTEATGSGTGGAKWAHGWVPLNDAAKRQVAANPEKFKQMRKKQKKQAKSVSLSAALERAALIEDPAAKVAARLAILDLAKPGQRYRHGWIRIDGVPVGKSRPKVAGSRGLKVDGLTKEQHSARVDRIAAIPRTERTRKQQDQFVRSNAVLRGEAVPARSSAPVGAEAVASQAATQAGIDARKARKGLPARQTPGSTDGMTDAAATHPHNAKIAETERRLRENDYQATKGQGPVVTNRHMLEKQQNALHTERGQALWPGLSPEAARHRSVQDHQYRTGAVSVGQNWKRPDWYTGPEPKRVKQGSGGFEVTAPRSEDPIGDAMRNAPRGRPARPPLSRRQTLAELNTKERKAARKNAPDPVAEAMRNAPAGKPSVPISAGKAQSELNARDAKASDRLIAEMPSMSEEHLKIAVNSPSTSQKVKDAAGAELAKRSPAGASSGRRPFAEQRIFGINKVGNRWEVTSRAKTAGHGAPDTSHGGGYATQRAAVEAAQKMAADYHAGGPLPPTPGGQSGRAAELRQGSTGRHPNADAPSSTPPPPFDRMTFKGHGIKHGDQIEAVKYDHQTKGPRVIRGTAHVKGSTIGVQEGDTLHDLGGTATKVMARKVTPPKGGAPVAGRANPPGAHPEKFKPGEKPAVHKFMNTERLQAIAAGDHPEHAATAKEILAKRGKSAGVPQAPPPAGLSSGNTAARGMTERILAKRAAASPPSEDTHLTNERMLNTALRHADPKVQQEALARAVTSGHAKVRPQKIMNSGGVSTDRMVISHGSTEHTFDKHPTQGWIPQYTSTYGNTSSSVFKTRRIDHPTLVKALDEAQAGAKRDPGRPVRGGSVAPPRPIGGAQGQGSAQTGHRMEIQTLITERFPELKGKSAGSIRGLIANLEDKAKRQGSLMQSDRNRLVAARRLLKAMG